MNREWSTLRIDPYTRQQRHQFASMALVTGGLALLALLETLNPRNNLVDKILFFLPACLLFVLVIPATLIGMSRLKRLVNMRESILHGGSALLTREQPVPDTNALPLPAIIELNKSKNLIILLGVTFALAFSIPFVAVAITGIGPAHKHSDSSFLPPIFLILTFAAIFALIVTLALIFWLSRKQVIYKLVVDEQGITSTYQGITSSIRWSDARLFALVSPDSPSALSFYELASSTTIVHWVNVPARSLFGWSNNPASMEYHNNVQALLSVVAARTGLPLYDLDATLKAKPETMQLQKRALE